MDCDEAYANKVANTLFAASGFAESRMKRATEAYVASVDILVLV